MKKFVPSHTLGRLSIHTRRLFICWVSTLSLSTPHKQGNIDNNGVIRASVEANLDVQYIMATGIQVPAYTYKVW
jgi:hypothetical protein